MNFRNSKIQLDTLSLMLVIQAEGVKEYKADWLKNQDTVNRNRLGQFARNPAAEAAKRAEGTAPLQAPAASAVQLQAIVTAAGDIAEKQAAPLDDVAKKMTPEEKKGVGQLFKTQEIKDAVASIGEKLGKLSEPLKGAFIQSWTVISDTVENMVKDTGTKATNFGAQMKATAIGMAKTATRPELVPIAAGIACSFAGAVVGAGISVASIVILRDRNSPVGAIIPSFFMGIFGRAIEWKNTRKFDEEIGELFREVSRNTPKDTKINNRIRTTQREIEKKMKEIERTPSPDQEQIQKLMDEISVKNTRIEVLREDQKKVQKYYESGAKVRDELKTRKEQAAARKKVMEIANKRIEMAEAASVVKLREAEKLEIIGQVQDEFYESLIKDPIKGATPLET